MRAHRVAALMATLAFAVIPATATADPYEPNDSSLQAWGPLAASTDYVGHIDTENDQDWFVFYVPGHQQVHIQVSSDYPKSESLSFSLKGSNDVDSNIYVYGEPKTIDLTLERGIYYIEVDGSYWDSTGPTYRFNILTNGSLVDRATYEWLVVKDQNEQAALAARAYDAGKISYWSGQVGYWSGRVAYWTGQVRRWQTDVGRKRIAARRAHGRNAINVARKRLSIAKQKLGNAQYRITQASHSLTSSKTNLTNWQGRWNIDNANVIKYA